MPDNSAKPRQVDTPAGGTPPLGEEYHRAVLESISDIVAVVTANYTFHYVSPAVERVLGHAVLDVVGRPLREFVHPEDARFLEQRTVSRLRGEADPDRFTEVRFRHRDGSWRNLQVRGQRHEQASGESVVVVTARDVTAQREAEAALRKSEAQLRQSQRLEAIGRLAGGVAHDFNNLLNVISGLVYLALMNLPDESEARGDLLEIGTTVRHAASLTQQLLAFSRQKVLEPKVLDLAEEVRQTSQLLRRVVEEDIELVTMLRSRGAVKADAGQLGQVLLNLAVNARDAMSLGGTLTVETRDVEVGEVGEGSYVELLVRDTGCGMDESTLAQLFEPFFTTKGPGEGTGLGLSTVYGIVKQSGGHIRVESAPGAGATFRIYLPRVALEPEQSPTPRRTPPGSRGETIMVIDDEPGVRMVATRILQRSGYHVVAASGGAEALRMLEELEGGLDLVLTDIVMPGTSGTELAELILDRDPGLRIMYMSGYTDDQVLRRGVRWDEVHFLQKPFEAAQLVWRVREVLERQ